MENWWEDDENAQSDQLKPEQVQPEEVQITPDQLKPDLNFDSKNWLKLCKHLDTSPVYRLVNKDNVPLAYAREGEGDPEPINIFFVEPERAKKEVELQNKRFPGQGIQLEAVGFGSAFMASCKGAAQIVPHQAALEQAPGVFLEGDIIPLYTNFAMRAQSVKEDGLDLEPGTKTVPLFMNPRDAAESLQASKEAAANAKMDQSFIDSLELSVCAMPVVVSSVIDGQEAELTGGFRFQFVPPKESLAYLREMQKVAGYTQVPSELNRKLTGRPDGSNPDLFGE